MQFTLRVLVLLIWIGHITISPEQCDASTRLMFASKTDQNFSFKGNLLNQSCRWKIQSVSSDYTVQVLCLVMSLMENRNCRDSSVTMYDGANESAPVIERLCNCSKGTYTSSGTFMFLRYDSNQMATSTQFEFLYRAVKKTESEAGPSSDDSALRGLVIIGACFLAVVLLIIVSYSIKKVNDNRNGEIGASTNASDHADQANGNLPPNYSDLSMRNGRLGLEPDAFTAQYSGENSVLATPPPVYAEFMLEIFPPKTPPTPKTRPLRSTEMREVELTGINPGIAHLTESAGLGPRSMREADIVEAETMNRNSLQSRERVVAKPTNRNRGPSRSTETAVSELENTEDNGTISTRL